MSLVALGTIGHRRLSGIDQVLAGVESALEHVLASYPGSSFRVFSCLAEGADRILAERLLQLPNTRLWVPLPLPQEEYLKDFESSESKEKFIHLLGKAERVILMPIMKTREEGYLAAGKYVVENSRVLLAVWDGKPAQGKGGTGDLVILARQRRLPLAWIHAVNSHPGTEITATLDPDQGKVTFENFALNGWKP